MGRKLDKAFGSDERGSDVSKVKVNTKGEPRVRCRFRRQMPGAEGSQVRNLGLWQARQIHREKKETLRISREVSEASLCLLKQK